MCKWKPDAPDENGGPQCACIPTDEPSLECKCEQHPILYRGCDVSPCTSCFGKCYKGQAEGSSCACASSCLNKGVTGIPVAGNCACVSGGKCAKKTATDITESNNKSDI